MESPLLGLILDSSVIIAAERKRQTVEELLTSVRQTFGEIEVAISAVTLAELVHGVARADTPAIRESRRAFIDELKKHVPVHPITEATAEIAGPGFSTWSRRGPSANGTSARRSRTAGAATCWCCRSKSASTAVKGKRRRTSARPCRRRNRTWRSRFSRTRTTSISSCSRRTPASESWSPGSLEHLRKFLLELGVGFAFVGSQYPLEVGGEDFRIDLLFYHLKLRCFVVIDLKMGAFKPEYAGKMNFYLSAVDDLLRHPADQPSIGVILCKSKNAVVAEYALRLQPGVLRVRSRALNPRDLPLRKARH